MGGPEEVAVKVYKRGLSNRQASACENAKHPRCKCRCGGRLHGAAHGLLQQNERAILANGDRVVTEDQITEIIDNILEGKAGEALGSRRQFPDPTARTSSPAPVLPNGQLPLFMEDDRHP